MSRLGPLIAASVAWLGASAALAAVPAPPPYVSVEMGPCLDVPRREVRRILRLELGDLQQLVDESGFPAQTARVQAACAPPLMTLRVEDPVGGQVRTRTLDLEAAPPGARPRLIAIAIAELVAASSAVPIPAPPGPVEPRKAVSPAAAPPRPAPAAPPPVVAKARPSHLDLGGAFSGCWFSGGAGLAASGGGVRLARTRGESLGFGADLIALHGQASVSLGSVRVDTLAGTATVLLGQPIGPLDLHAGPGVRVGVARLAGRPSMPEAVLGESQTAPWAGILGTLGASVTLGERWFLDLAAEGGFVVWEAGGLVGGRREVSISGGWAAARFGLGMSL